MLHVISPKLEELWTDSSTDSRDTTLTGDIFHTTQAPGETPCKHPIPQTSAAATLWP